MTPRASAAVVSGSVNIWYSEVNMFKRFCTLPGSRLFFFIFFFFC